MAISRVINRRTAVLGLLLVILATAGFGFAASNTIDPSSAGDGTGTVSGFTVTNIDYVLNPTNPGVIDGVNFNLAPQAGGATTPPSSVKVLLENGGTDWYDCSYTAASSPWAYTCNNGATTVLAANQMRVVAAN